MGKYVADQFTNHKKIQSSRIEKNDVLVEFPSTKQNVIVDMKGFAHVNNHPNILKNNISVDISQYNKKNFGNRLGEQNPHFLNRNQSQQILEE
jgi:hypothetical protein